MHMYMYLYYENLDEMHAWKLLQHDAHSIIARHGFSISPHELMLGQCGTRPEIASDPQHVQLFTFVAHGKLI